MYKGITMLTHIALLKFKKGLFNADKQAIIDKVLALKKKIPEIGKAYGGPDCVKFENDVVLNKGYTFAISMEFADEKALTTYLQHPAQHELDDILKKSLEDVIIITLRS